VRRGGGGGLGAGPGRNGRCPLLGAGARAWAPPRPHLARPPPPTPFAALPSIPHRSASQLYEERKAQVEAARETIARAKDDLQRVSDQLAAEVDKRDKYKARLEKWVTLGGGLGEGEVDAGAKAG
jgi:hypothetical protein